MNRSEVLPVTGPRKELVSCGMMAALIAVFSWISLPLGFSPVPLTLQTLGVLLAGGLLGRAWGPASVGVFLLLGLVGAPSFTTELPARASWPDRREAFCWPSCLRPW